MPLRHVEAARLTLHSERIAEAGLAVQFCIVFVSSDGLRRPAPTGLFVQGHRLWSRDVNLQPNSVPLAIGTAKALLAWRLRLTGRGTSGPTVDED